MAWSDTLTRLRRWVRDPDGDIFTEAFLQRLYNNELQQLFSLLGLVADVQVVRVPPIFQESYVFDWEWAYSAKDDGEVYQAFRYYDTDDYAFMYVWEAEQLKGFNATTGEAGEVYTHPWEAWAVSSPYFPPPIPLPTDFESVLYLAFDRERIDPQSKTEILRLDDTTWKTRGGEPVNYWRDEEASNWVYLYPLPSAEWQDSESDVSADPDEAEYGNTNIDVDDNLLAVYLIQPTEIEASDDETELPGWLEKYIEYGTAERALRANTDGRIESLADYWGLRKKAGYEAIRKYLRLKTSDRRIQLRTRDGSSGGSRPKYPRLPSTYQDEAV